MALRSADRARDDHELGMRSFGRFVAGVPEVAKATAAGDREGCSPDDADVVVRAHNSRTGFLPAQSQVVYQNCGLYWR